MGPLTKRALEETSPGDHRAGLIENYRAQIRHIEFSNTNSADKKRADLKERIAYLIELGDKAASR